MGSSVDTWTNSDTKEYFPTLLSSDPTFSKNDILTIDLPSPLLTSSMGIDELGERLRLLLDAQGVSNYGDLNFVVHSMGGLVLRTFLKKNPSVAQKVKFVYFYSTPTTGSSLATIAKFASNNPQFAKMVPMTSDAYLADLQRDWLNSTELSSVPSFCAYELGFVNGFKVVEQQSATNLCNRRLDPMEYNHIDIVKPKDITDIRHLAMKSAYLSIGKKVSTALRVEIQNPSQIREPLQPGPKLAGDQVFCEAIQFTLLLAHTGQEKTPIRVSGISVFSEDIKEQLRPTDSCDVDVLSSRPYGISQVDSYMFTDNGFNLKGKFVVNAEKSFDISPANILRGSNGTRAISLKYGEEPFGIDMVLQTSTDKPRRVWFSVQYDEDGPRTLVTKPVLIWR